MKLGLVRGALGSTVSSFLRLALNAALTMTLAGVLAACTHSGQPKMTSLQPRGATVAFESIDGPPPAQFHALVRGLNDEAQSRRLAVISREESSAYRVRGYLAAKVVKGRTTISWVWDVFDRDQNRALRIDGQETANEAAEESAKSARDPWSVADDVMLARIARTSMDQLAAFLTSPGIVPNRPDDAVQIALSARQDSSNDSSAEAAGIFRFFKAQADPALQAEPVSPDSAAAPAVPDEIAGPVPLPPRRPGASMALSAGVPLELAASILQRIGPRSSCLKKTRENEFDPYCRARFALL